ncbi:MAG: SGNH/GDSL hydrolase family protein [Planctomycetales bacterium]
MTLLFRTVRRLFTAVWLMIALYCIGEVGVRVWDGFTGKVSQRLGDDPDLLVRSWTVHHELKPQQQVTRKTDKGKAVVIKTNSRGLRGSEVQVPKPTGVYRIVCLGDERILGPHVREAETFPVQLQNLLQSRSSEKIEVINAGVPDYCPLLSEIQFEQKLVLLQPDLVLLNFDMTDVADDYRYRRGVTFDEGGHPLSCVHSSLDLPHRPGDWLFGESLMLPRWGRHALATWWCNNAFTGGRGDICNPAGKYCWIEDQPPDWSIHINHALTPIAGLRDRAKSLSANFVLTVCPAPFQVSPTACNGIGVRTAAGVKRRGVYNNVEPFQRVQEYCQRERILCCDVTPALKQDPAKDQLFLKSAIELSGAGNGVFARTVGVFLVRNVSGAWRGPGVAPVSSDPGISPAAFHSQRSGKQDIREKNLRTVEHTE